MTDDSAATLLHEVAELRRRTRRDRHAYWPPMLLLGALILAAPLVYGRAVVLTPGVFYSETPPQFRIPGTGLYVTPLALFGPPFMPPVTNPTGIAVYWLCVVVVGLAATVAWYRWRGTRVGLETSTRAFVLVGIAGLLVLLGVLPVIAELLRLPYVGFYSSAGFWVSVAVFLVAGGGAVLALRSPAGERRPVWRGVVGGVGIAVAVLSATSLVFYGSSQGYAPLLVLGAALLALAVIERSRLCTVVAVLFMATAMLAGLYNVENEFYRLGMASSDPRVVAFAHVLLPGVVLIVGGVVGARRTSR